MMEMRGPMKCRSVTTGLKARGRYSRRRRAPYKRHDSWLSVGGDGCTMVGKEGFSF